MTKFSLPAIPKQNNFTLLRMLCCFIVIYEHAVSLSGSSLLNLNFRGIAVNVFFILSGFWVTFSLLRSNSLKEYAVKRFNKIFPLYWTVVLLFAFILCFVSTVPVYDYFLSNAFLKYIAANLSTLNFIKPNLPGVFEGLPLNGAVNGSLWTIKVEVGFYIILPLILLIIERARKIMRGGKCIAFAVIFMLSIVYSILCDFLCAKYSISDSIKNQLPAFMTYFVCGMAFCLYWEKLECLLNYCALPSFIVFILLKIFDISVLSYVFMPVSLSILVMWFGTHHTFLSKLCKNDYSYTLYLIHFPLVMLFIQYGFFDSCWILAFSGVLGLSFLCSCLLSKTVSARPL